jgi:hypothetical protein
LGWADGAFRQAGFSQALQVRSTPPARLNNNPDNIQRAAYSATFAGVAERGAAIVGKGVGPPGNPLSSRAPGRLDQLKKSVKVSKATKSAPASTRAVLLKGRARFGRT